MRGFDWRLLPRRFETGSTYRPALGDNLGQIDAAEPLANNSRGRKFGVPACEQKQSYAGTGWLLLIIKWVVLLERDWPLVMFSTPKLEV